MIVAIVPAAGKSERMGRSKLLLPLGPRRVLEHVLDALAHTRVDRTLVVIPPDAPKLRALVVDAGAVPVELADITPDMRASIAHGLTYAEQVRPVSPPDAFLVALADQPALSAGTVNHLIDRFASYHSPLTPHSDTPLTTNQSPLTADSSPLTPPAVRSIFIPTHAGRRGHPVLFAWRHARQVQSLAPGRGLNQLVADCAAVVEECPIETPSILDDVDTPQDYERAQKAVERGTRASGGDA